jgi:MHS family proline/betaine transporter-like MFS transporter
VLSLCMGMLLGSLMATMASNFLTRNEYESWGWRIPFLLGVVIAYVGHYIRHNTEESPAYEKARDEGKLSDTPVMEVCRHHRLLLLRGIGIYLSVTVPFYTLTVFLPGFLHKFQAQPESDALLMGTAAMIVMMCMVPLTGWLSDKIGHKRLLMAISVVYFFTAYPIFVMLTRPGFWEPFMAELLFSFIVSFYIGTAPAVFVELFPTSVRYTGMALSYNICAAVFGGTTPIIGTWLMMQSHKPPLSDNLLIQEMEPNTIMALYLMLCAVLSFISFLGYHDRYREDLE